MFHLELSFNEEPLIPTLHTWTEWYPLESDCLYEYDNKSASFKREDWYSRVFRIGGETEDGPDRLLAAVKHGKRQVLLEDFPYTRKGLEAAKLAVENAVQRHIGRVELARGLQL